MKFERIQFPHLTAERFSHLTAETNFGISNFKNCDIQWEGKDALISRLDKRLDFLKMTISFMNRNWVVDSNFLIV